MPKRMNSKRAEIVVEIAKLNCKRGDHTISKPKSIHFDEFIIVKYEFSIELDSMLISGLKENLGFIMQHDKFNFPPRVIRLRDAPRYLGMDIHRFNAEVRPHIPEVSIGIQGVGFDRIDLDRWFDQYKACRVRSITRR